jgi:hypothetical protein
MDVSKRRSGRMLFVVAVFCLSAVSQSPAAFAEHKYSSGLAYHNPAYTVCDNSTVDVNWPADSPFLGANLPIKVTGDTSLNNCSSSTIPLPAGLIGVRLVNFDRTYPDAHICTQSS